ncbi:MAG: hypothetical protein FD143_3202 [Ignavibacteria bacterium]|nr:MAG: hypothetical protein FD143_3202 [Ignavibacteria bacterium]
MEGGDYIRDYLNVLSALDLDSNPQVSLSLSPQEWANGSTFFAFKISPNQSQHPPSGSVRLELKFSESTTQSINILLLAESISSIEIDKYKNVLIL